MTSPISYVIPANTKHLYNICTMSAQRLRRWSNIVRMLYKRFVFAGIWLYHPLIEADVLLASSPSVSDRMSFHFVVFFCENNFWK